MTPESTSPRVRAALPGTLLAVLLAAAPAAAQSDDGKIVIRAGRVITQAGAEVQNGLIVIEDGRIRAVGADVDAPWEAEVLDATDLVAFPGFVEAHTNRGMDRPNENVDVAPFLSVRDSIDPVNFYFEDSLRQGITTINVQQGANCVIGAQGMVVKPWGMTVEEMLVRPKPGIKLSAAPKSGKSRATQVQALRGAFDGLRRELEGMVQDVRDGRAKSRREAMFQGRDQEEEDDDGREMQSSAWSVEGLELVSRRDIDEKQRPLLDLVEGRIGAYFWCGAPMDVARALEIARDNGFLARTTLILDSSCWKAADEIEEAGVPVVLNAPLVHRERDPITGEEVETFVPGVFKEKGVAFALSSANQNEESLWLQAALAIGGGLERQEALDAVTTAPAKMLGLGDRVGSLEPGKDGNVVLFSGDPLSVQSSVEYVVIEGNLVYDRSKDVRARHLLEGVQPEGTAAAGEEEVQVHDDEHGEESDDQEEKKDSGEEDEDEDEEEGDEE